MTLLPPRRRWPEAVLAVALAIAAVWFGGAARLVAVALLAVLAVFAARRRALDVPMAIGAALLALGVLVATALTIDVGSAFDGALRKFVEREASAYFDRPLHIGRLGVRLGGGTFVIEQARIEGLEPQHRPFLTAREVRATISWRRLLSKREIVIESIEASDWELLIEDPGGRSNFIRFGDPKKPKRKYPVELRIGKVHATRGKVTYYDYGSWHAIAPNVDIDIVRAGGEFRGRGSASAGELQIEGYLPMRSDIVATFAIREGRFVVFDRIDLTTDTAVGRLTGTVDVRRWPEMTFARSSRASTSSACAKCSSRTPRGAAAATRTSPAPSTCSRADIRLDGPLASPLASGEPVRVSRTSAGRGLGADRFEVLEATARPYTGTAKFSYSMKPLDENPKPADVARFDTCYDGVDLGATLRRAVPAAASACSAASPAATCWSTRSAASRCIAAMGT